MTELKDSVVTMPKFLVRVKPPIQASCPNVNGNPVNNKHYKNREKVIGVYF
jgi:hypothetical protein